MSGTWTSIDLGFVVANLLVKRILCIIYSLIACAVAKPCHMKFVIIAGSRHGRPVVGASVDLPVINRCAVDRYLFAGRVYRANCMIASAVFEYMAP